MLLGVARKPRELPTGHPHGSQTNGLQPNFTKLKTYIVDAEEGISPASALLAHGDVVALPTETVYGLAANALNPAACAKIFEAKDRPLSDPLIVHLPDMEWLGRLAAATPTALRLAEHFWPGPLTLVLPRTAHVQDIVTSGQDTVAVRMSAHPVFRSVVLAFGKPLAAPSANRFGRISPTSADHVVEELDGRIPLVVDGGPCEHGIESTIVLVRGDRLHILRRGPVTARDLADFGAVGEADGTVGAPGGMKSHYAPGTPLVIADGPPEPRGRSGLLAWSHSGEGFAQTEHLSRSQDPREAAANLYGAMRRLDAAGLDVIVAEQVPETGLGAAIMERLRKAAAR